MAAAKATATSLCTSNSDGGRLVQATSNVVGGRLPPRGMVSSRRLGVYRPPLSINRAKVVKQGRFMINSVNKVGTVISAIDGG